MFYEKLCTPVLLLSQISELTAALEIDEDKLRSLLLFEHVLVTKEEDGQTQYSIGTMKDALPDTEPLSGTEAIIKLCEANGVECNPITEINLPVEVYQMSSNTAWLDLSYFIGKIVVRNQRLEMLNAASAPYVILQNEKRMLREFVECLDNNVYDTRRDNGIIRRSLSDIGYHLLSGWEQEILDKWDEDAQGFQEAFDAALAANTDSKEA